MGEWRAVYQPERHIDRLRGAASTIKCT
jgi:hypothetical protein